MDDDLTIDGYFFFLLLHCSLDGALLSQCRLLGLGDLDLKSQSLMDLTGLGCQPGRESSL